MILEEYRDVIIAPPYKVEYTKSSREEVRIRSGRKCWESTRGREGQLAVHVPGTSAARWATGESGCWAGVCAVQ